MSATGPSRRPALLAAVVTAVFVALVSACTPTPPAPEPVPTTSAADGVVAGPPTAPPATVDLAAASPVDVPTERYVRLQSVFSAADSRCLEGNTVAEGSFLSGAAFMDACQDVTGQLWKITPSSEAGFFTVRSRAGEEAGTCLDGNGGTAAAVAGGSAYQGGCAESDTQRWRFVASQDGTYRLQTRASIAENRCLESNMVDALALQGGATFLDSCAEVSGQLWTLQPVTDDDLATAGRSGPLDLTAVDGTVPVDTARYHRLQSAAGENCLTGGSPAAAAADVSSTTCGDTPGQRWKLLPTDDGQYVHLQVQGSEADALCLDVDAASAAARFVGCADIPGQDWRFVDAGDGSVRMQTLSGVAANECLAASGAAAPPSMVPCAADAAQQWRLVPIEGADVAPEGRVTEG